MSGFQLGKIFPVTNGSFKKILQKLQTICMLALDRILTRKPNGSVFLLLHMVSSLQPLQGPRSQAIMCTSSNMKKCRERESSELC